MSIRNLVFIGLSLLFVCPLLGQLVYEVDYESQADFNVFVVKYESQADLLVFKERYESSAVDNEGHWFFTEYESRAHKSVFLSKYESQADLKIYYVNYESRAGWKDSSKKSLLD